MKKAVVLLSGGLDSSTVLFIAKRQGYELYALTCNYGQRHLREIEAAKQIANIAGVVEHRIVDFTSFTILGSALTVDIDVPDEGLSEDIPVTYVPARNTIFLSFALSWAEQIEAEVVFCGVNAIDYSGYPDCRPEYIAAMQEVYRLGTKCGIEDNPILLAAPLSNMTKVDIVRRALELEPNILKLSWSCYQGSKEPCGVCDSCRIRQDAMLQV